MKYILVVLVSLVPFVSSAETYFYVNAEGDLASVEAQDAQHALLLAQNPSSGVVLDLGGVTPGMVDSTIVRARAGIEEIPLVFDRPSVQPWSGATLFVPTMNWNGLMPGHWGGLPW